MVLKICVVLSLVLSCLSLNTLQTIHLTANNTVVLKGKINDESVSYVVKEIIKNAPKYMFIDSSGGSMIAGSYLLETLRNVNLTCIIGRAYSMAFVILQACETRYILQTSTTMQHQASLRVDGELLQIKEYIDMVSDMEDNMNEMQSARIGMAKKDFVDKVKTEWWSYGHNIVKNGIADDIVSITCSKDLVNKKIKIKEISFIFETTRVYSACPLIPDT